MEQIQVKNNQCLNALNAYVDEYNYYNNTRIKYFTLHAVYTVEEKLPCAYMGTANSKPYYFHLQGYEQKCLVRYHKILYGVQLDKVMRISFHSMLFKNLKQERNDS